MPARRSSVGWTFAITALALFMVALDNLVVTTALPVIQRDLNSTLQDLEWMVNAYTLTFAVLLLTGAALGDRFGRRRFFVIGLAIFTFGSAAAALAPSSTVLILARAVQGVGGALVTPLSLTILSAGVPPAKRALALGAWGGVAGLAIAIGPLVGGAISQGISWHWIFWLNVPIGILAVILAYFRLDETFGPEGSLDLVGLGLASAGLLGLVWGVIHGNDLGWTNQQVLIAMTVGVILLIGFVLWERRSAHPMLPLSMFRSRGFAAANNVSFLMYFGMFGSIFLLVQYFQLVQGLKPFEAGLRTLPWTAMPIFVAPLAGLATPRFGTRAIIVAGMILMTVGLAWIASVLTVTTPYLQLVPGFIIGRCRHGPVLRPDRQRRPLGGQPGPGGQGVGRQQCDPRGRRRLWSRGSRLGLLGLWLVCLAPGVRQRPRAGDVGRRRDRGPRDHPGRAHSGAPRGGPWDRGDRLRDDTGTRSRDGGRLAAARAIEPAGGDLRPVAQANVQFEEPAASRLFAFHATESSAGELRVVRASLTPLPRKQESDQMVRPCGRHRANGRRPLTTGARRLPADPVDAADIVFHNTLLTSANSGESIRPEPQHFALVHLEGVSP